eukprot:TRINITY_DN4659_c2_g1_i1.p1 TRINITY_DN4659_c2_g1~~TRINITY_DN4659_c2_g1_i1.p1  ORF type:complete len:1265 (+),score=316.66 TRINITY_DN4659_c2_g1_i1:31-3825(+)
MALRVTCILGLLAGAACDVYLHNPKGSNNKLFETSNAVRNNQRLFNSQNNNRGGYQIGDNCEPACRRAAGNDNYDDSLKGAGEGQLAYYEGTVLDIEYTVQHGCGGDNVNCQIVLQYACGEDIRDGRTHDKTPVKSANEDNYYFAMHEPYDNVDKCYKRQRNKGLYTADQNLRGDKGAMATRQNRQGSRRGWECQEERDYYPYWHPSIWRDIAVLTDRPDMCPFYQQNSENVEGRGECVTPDLWSLKYSSLPNNKAACFKADYTWVERDPHNIPPPYCGRPEFSRDNHLGNTVGGLPATYKWTIPHNLTGSCVLRIRYNISTYDHSPTGDWDLDYKKNKADEAYMKNDVVRDLIGFADIKMYEDIGDELLVKNAVVKMATNTNQVGRTFQDRTHTFKTLKRPEGLEKAEIHNLNVRGRRGNIVNVYPSVEYDFVPTHLKVAKGDYVHMQWTDSDAASANNAGNGLAGTGRSNVVMLHNSTLGSNIPQLFKQSSKDGGIFSKEDGSPDRELIAFFSMLAQERCEYDAKKINLKDENNVRNCATLNRASGTINGGLVKMNRAGKHAYMSTRNNDFSNRSQKGLIEVVAELILSPSETGKENKVSEARTAAVLGTLSGLTLLLIVYFVTGTYARANPHKSWTQHPIVKKLHKVPAMPVLTPSGCVLVTFKQDTVTEENFDKKKFAHDVADVLGVEAASVEVLSLDADKVQFCAGGENEVREKALLFKNTGVLPMGSRGWDIIAVSVLQQEDIPPESEQAVNRKWRWIKLLVGAQLLLFFLGVITNRSVYVRHGNMWLPLAKGAGVTLNFLLVILPIPTLKVLLGSLRGTPASNFIDLDAAFGFHKLVANCVFGLALMHITAHILDMEWFKNRHCSKPYCNDSVCECTPGHWGMSYGQQLRLISGWTGLIVTVLFAIIYFNAFSFRRKAGNTQSCPFLVTNKYSGFDRFWYTHHLWIPTYLFMLLHAPKFYCWVAVPLLLFALEKAIAYWRLSQPASIESATLVSKDVVQLTVRKVGFRHTSGQYVKLLIPELSQFVAHPFTVSSAPQKDVFSVHIKAGREMDWTVQMKEALFPGGSYSYPSKTVFTSSQPPPLHVAVDGPFVTASQEYINYDTAVLVGAGIGVTPFASILKSVLEGEGRLQPAKTYFYWLVGEEEQFSWFADIMNDVKTTSDKVEIHTHLTGAFDLETYTERLKTDDVPWSVQKTGRPNWKKIFPKIVATHTPSEPSVTHRIGVFYCGPPELGITLSSMCEKASTQGVRFTFNREVF